MNKVVHLGIWLPLAVMQSGVARAQTLQRDPFRAPDEVTSPASRPDALVGFASGKPEIRGILLAGGESLVNLGGEIIGPGEEASGYTLLEVGEEHAVFLHDDEVVTLSLYPDESENTNDDD